MMEKKDFRFLGKKELIELLIKTDQENNELREQLELARKETEKYKKAAQIECGSMLDARIGMEKLFAAAQITADNYVETAKEEADKKTKQCQELVNLTIENCKKMEEAVRNRSQELLEGIELFAAAQVNREQETET